VNPGGDANARALRSVVAIAVFPSVLFATVPATFTARVAFVVPSRAFCPLAEVWLKRSPRMDAQAMSIPRDQPTEAMLVVLGVLLAGYVE
jgi:hypothetical protein